MPKFVHEDTLHPCVKCGRLAYPELTVGYVYDSWRIAISCELCGNRKLVMVNAGQREYPAQDVLDTIEAWNVENPAENCASCTYWERQEEFNQYGRCKLPYSLLQITKENGFCSEYKHKGENE